MKRNLRGLILTVVAFAFFQTIAFGQDLKPFEINSKFRKSTYDGVKIRKMKAKRLKEIILASKDPEAIKHFKASRGWRIAASIFYCTLNFGPGITCAIISNVHLRNAVLKYNKAISVGASNQYHLDNQPVEGYELITLPLSF